MKMQSKNFEEALVISIHKLHQALQETPCLQEYSPLAAALCS